MRGRPIDELAVGDWADLSRVASPGDVAEFVDSIGDHNPIHHDAGFAAQTRFERPIVPGMWTTGLISAVLGTQLPGPGCIYVSQQVTFTAPVYFGDTITARVEVVERLPDRNRIRVRTTAVNQDGVEVVTGEALLLPPKQAVVYTQVTRGAAAVAHWALQPWLWGVQAAGAWARMSTAAFSAWQSVAAPETGLGGVPASAAGRAEGRADGPAGSKDGVKQ